MRNVVVQFAYMAKRGRPTTFSGTIADQICQRLANGESLRSIVKDKHMPEQKTVYNWLLDPDHKDGFLQQYKEARELQADHLADETLEIADDATNDWMDRQIGGEDGDTIRVIDHEHVQRSKLRVDTRKWYVSKVAAKKYGDKLDVTSAGEKVAVAGFNYVRPDADTQANA